MKILINLHILCKLNSNHNHCVLKMNQQIHRQLYQQILMRALDSGNIPVNCGEAVIVIWKNREHLEEWCKMKIATSEDIRISRHSLK